MTVSSPVDPNAVRANLGAGGVRHGGWRPRVWLVGTLIGVGMLGLAGWWWLRAEGPVPQFRTEPVNRGNLVVTITATGQLAPVNEVEVGSELSGTLAEIKVDYNDRVKAGDVLARLDTQELDASVVQQRAALAVAEARVKQAEATLEEAGLSYRRARDLAGRKLASQQELDTAQAARVRAEADLAGARAQVAQARAALEAVQTKLAKAVIRAPISGIVLSRNVEPGQTVAAAFNTPVLFSLAEDLRRMELHVDVDEADVGHLREGQSATFTVDAYPGRVFPATVTQVRFAPRTVEGVVTYETLLGVANDDLLLRPGMTATAEIAVARVDDALLVPNAALRFVPPAAEPVEQRSGNVFSTLMPHRPRTTRQAAAGSGSRVWVLAQGKLQEVAVKTGLSDGRYTELTGGELAAGAKVITGLQEGQ